MRPSIASPLLPRKRTFRCAASSDNHSSSTVRDETGPGKRSLVDYIRDTAIFGIN
jgi:hypothetical protein